MKEQNLQSPSTRNLVQRRLSHSPKTFVDKAANKENEIQIFEDDSFQEFEAFDDQQR